MIKKDKIKIDKFVKEYKMQATDNLKANYIKRTIDVKQYIPIDKKIAFAENIVNSSSWLRDAETKKRIRIHVNSPAKFLMTCRCIIEAYTNLESYTGTWFEEYDLLNECGVLDEIFKMIPDKERGEFNTILSMTFDDMMTNNYGVQAYVAAQVERFGELTGTLLAPYIDKLAESVRNVDDEAVGKAVGKLSKLIDKIKK